MRRQVPRKWKKKGDGREIFEEIKVDIFLKIMKDNKP